VGENAGRGLFATQDIPAYSHLDLAGSVKSFNFDPWTWSVIEDMYEDSARHVQEALGSMYTFASGYGYAATLLGEMHYTVDPGIMNFCNHGCNGTYSHGAADKQELGFTEMNVDLDDAPEDLFEEANDFVYSPVIERHLRQRLNFGDTTLRNIRQGEEILCDYLSFVGKEDWVEDVIGLRQQCSGEAVGDIQEYELYNSEPGSGPVLPPAGLDVEIPDNSTDKCLSVL